MSLATTEEIVVDVSAVVPFGEDTSLSGKLHLPAGEPRAVLVCWPGGSYDRRSWQFDAVPGYSFAEHMTNRGSRSWRPTTWASAPARLPATSTP
jgi:hypothetical protein